MAAVVHEPRIASIVGEVLDATGPDGAIIVEGGEAARVARRTLGRAAAIAPGKYLAATRPKTMLESARFRARLPVGWG